MSKLALSVITVLCLALSIEVFGAEAGAKPSADSGALKKSASKKKKGKASKKAAVETELAPSDAPTRVSGACTANESWSFSTNVTRETRENFQALLNHRMVPVRGFSEALALRRKLENSVESRVFGEYWLARSLYEAKLIHIAYQGFAVLANYSITPDTLGVQLAALECINRIHRRYPSFKLAAHIAPRLSQYLSEVKTKKEREPVWEFATNLLIHQLAEKSSREEVLATFDLLKGSQSYEHFARGIWASRLSDHPKTIQLMEKFFLNPSLPAPLSARMDQARLLLSRAYYSAGQYEKSAEQLKLIRKSSNELAKALSELAWAYLQNDQYSEAIGTAINLQSGGLRKTFAPEGPMVMAMALNELCLYPESVRAIGVFRKYYEKPYRWLNTWFQNRDKGVSDLYPYAVSFLKKQSQVPDKVGTEWVRSPLFIAMQEEINLLLDEKDAAVKLSRSGATAQRSLGVEILAMSRALKPKIKGTRASIGPDEPLPSGLRAELRKMRRQIESFIAMRRAAPVWKSILANYQKSAPLNEKRLLASINSDLKERSVKMLRQLEEIAENNQLIEVEIYNGASEDIIWQNAHPEYKQVAQEMKNEQQKAAGSQTWDWGRSPANNEENQEVWEDELGSFKADLYDNCSSKDKFLALKRIRRR